MYSIKPCMPRLQQWGMWKKPNCCCVSRLIPTTPLRRPCYARAKTGIRPWLPCFIATFMVKPDLYGSDIVTQLEQEDKESASIIAAIQTATRKDVAIPVTDAPGEYVRVNAG